MSAKQWAAAFAVVGTLAVSDAASAAIQDLTPTGYISDGGFAAYGDFGGLLPGTHRYTFWTSATPTASNGINLAPLVRVHDDADFGNQGFAFTDNLAPVFFDLDRLRSGDGSFQGASVTYTLPDDYEVYLPDYWGPGNGGTTRYHFFGDIFVGQAFGAGDAGLPFWVTIDAPEALTAVPEPGMWAMLIAGFGLAGAVLRRRRAFA